MRFPQVIVCGSDDWIAKQLADLIAEHRWLVQSVRRPSAALAAARELRPTVVLIQTDPTTADPAALQLVADLHVIRPDVPTVIVSDVKLPEESRALWAAAVLDLGARFVLFPPLTKPVLEDVVSGFLASAIRNTGGATAHDRTP